MNVLPLILALILVLSVVTIEQFEKVKNQLIVHRKYQLFLKEGERYMFNLRQRRLANKNEPTHRQISFVYLIKKEKRDNAASKAKQYRLLIIDLMKIVYGEAAFFKEMEKKRPQFLEELFQAIEEAIDRGPSELCKRIEDIARLNLGDPELQKVFYHMLKGTGRRKDLKTLPNDPDIKEKAYPSLFTFIHNCDQPIVVQRCSKEVLKAIFLKDEVVDAICTKRRELSAVKGQKSAVTKIFKTEFNEQRREGLDNDFLDFSITESDKTDYD